MPITAIALASSNELESKYDPSRGTAAATKFEVGVLDSRIFGMLRDKAMAITVNPERPDDDVEQSIRGNEVAFLFVQYALKGWTNFLDEKGNDIPFKTVKRNHGGKSYTVADPELVRLIPGAVIGELADAVRKQNDLEEVEAKN